MTLTGAINALLLAAESRGIASPAVRERRAELVNHIGAMVLQAKHGARGPAAEVEAADRDGAR